LMAKRFTTMIRQSKGVDILAACGQLGGGRRPIE
jgi:adenine C2-methylase RlmN of 23S rRNA A2503 and tRNA A37